MLQRYEVLHDHGCVQGTEACWSLQILRLSQGLCLFQENLFDGSQKFRICQDGRQQRLNQERVLCTRHFQWRGHQRRKSPNYLSH